MSATSSTPGQVLRTLTRDGLTWQLRQSADAGRVELVCLVPPSATTTVVRIVSFNGDTDDASQRIGILN